MRPAAAQINPHLVPVPTASEAKFVPVDPFTGTARPAIPIADDSQVAQAVACAKILHNKEKSGEITLDRRAVLLRLTQAFRENPDALAAAISADMGAPLAFAKAKQVEAAAQHLDAFAAATQDPDIIRGTGDVRYAPHGVAGLITPWNWPLNQIALKLGAALMAGCTMVLKPSEYAMGTAQVLADILHDLDLPPGLITIVLGDRATGAALTHAGVDVLSFTGSTQAGRAVAQAAAQHLIPAHLELGGKSANILFDDCDLPLAVIQGVAHCFRNTGQSCNAASRMLVHRPIYDQVCALATSEAEKYAHTNGDAYALGAQVNATQWDKIQSHIQTAQDQGAHLLTGGTGNPKQQGFFTKPTVFADVTPDMALFRDEVFGPVLSITPFDTEEGAIKLANMSDYGLAGYIQTTDPDRANRVADRLDVGMVQVNGQSRAQGAPFGGIKHSGYGREAGIWGIRAFQYVKSVSGCDPA